MTYDANEIRQQADLVALLRSLGAVDLTPPKRTGFGPAPKAATISQPDKPA